MRGKIQSWRTDRVPMLSQDIGLTVKLGVKGVREGVVIYLLKC